MYNQRNVLKFARLVLDFSGFQTVFIEEFIKSVDFLLGLDDLKCGKAIR